MRQSTDIVSPETRSRMMKAVGQKDTKPELMVRRLLLQLGVRYRVRNRDLPGSPDVANRKRRWAVFVNGCFWHGHKNCRKTKAGRGIRVPRQNSQFWQTKLVDNRHRDARNCRDLRKLGYRTVVVWECELYDGAKVKRRLRKVVRGERD